MNTQGTTMSLHLQLQRVLGTLVAAAIASSCTAQTPVDLAASTVTVKTSTATGQSRGITYRIMADATFPFSPAGTRATIAPDAESFIVISVVAPSATKSAFTLDFNLDEDAPGTNAAQLHVAADTSFGLRGQGEMPTALHPRYELTFKDTPGDYGSALLIQSVRVLAFVSKPVSFNGESAKPSVLVALDFQPQAGGAAVGGSFEESTFKASRVVIWPYNPDFLSSAAKNDKAGEASVETAKALLKRIEKH